MARPLGRLERINVPVVLRDHRDRLRSLENKSPHAAYEIKIFSDQRKVQVLDPAFGWMIPEDLNGWYIIRVHCFVTTVSSSGVVEVRLRRTRSAVTVNVTSTNVTIDANELTSYTAATQPVINQANNQVLTGDIMKLIVDQAGTNARGLGAVVWLRPAKR